MSSDPILPLRPHVVAAMGKPALACSALGTGLHQMCEEGRLCNGMHALLHVWLWF